MTSAEHSRILITGASGFVGNWLVRELFAQHAGAPIDILTLDHVRTTPIEGVRSAHADISNPDELARIVRTFSPTAVIHLAAVSAPMEARTNPRRAWDVNAGGTLNLANAVLTQAPDASFVFASSSEVYGQTFNLEPGPVREDARLRPIDTYGTTKAAAELILSQQAYRGLKAICFRPFNHSGPGQTEKFALSSFARQIALAECGKQPPTMAVGNLDAERDFLDVRDVVRAYAQAALSTDQRLLSAGAVNLASGQSYRIGDLLEILISQANLPIGVTTNPDLLRPNEIPRTLGDATLARDLMDWSASIPIATTLKNLLQGWRETVAKLS